MIVFVLLWMQLRYIQDYKYIELKYNIFNFIG